MATTKIKLKAGKDNQFSLVYRDGTGNAVNISDGSARLVVRKGYFQPAIIDIAAIMNPDITSGEMTFKLTKAAMTGILSGDHPEEKFIGDIELTLAGESFDLFDDLEVELK